MGGRRDCVVMGRSEGSCGKPGRRPGQDAVEETSEWEESR